MITEKEVLENIKVKMMSIRGVAGVAELNEEQRETVACLEEESMKNILAGMGRGKNEGVKESLSRNIAMVFFMNIDFELPKDVDMMKLYSGGEMVGMALMDSNRIKEFKKDKNYVVISDFFVLKKGAKINSSAFANGEAYFVFNGIQIDQFSRIQELQEHVVSIPSPPVFDFLKEQFRDKIDLFDPQLGALIVGFNLS
ncbi:MAG: hypothetical protein HXX80_04500 [Nitrososphaerales archaeon]|nr:hypothetical protein [Nitrososphaerales archaeon]